MPETRIEQLNTTSIATAKPEFSVGLETTDGVEAGIGDTEWTDPDYSSHLSYYKNIPELKHKIDTYASWTVGKGYIADPETTLLLDTIDGNGKDTFNTIIENLIRVKKYGGNAYAEIVSDDDNNLINLKPLDPASMRHIVNKTGRIIRFEQTTKIGEDKVEIISFQPEELFYLANDRVADEIHGTSIIESIKDLLDARNEAMTDMRKLMHRNVVPVRLWHVGTDETNRIATFKEKIDEAVKNQENIIIPQGTVESELMAVAPNASLNPIPWIDNLGRYISQATRVPDIVNGNSTNLTEASAKIEYLSWQQTIEDEQTYIEQQILAQLNIVLEFNFPARLENEALSEEQRPDEELNQQTNMQANVKAPEVQEERAVEPNDITAEEEGRK